MTDSLNDKDLIYEGYRSNSSSLTIADIYDRLDMLGKKFELVNARLSTMDDAIAGLEDKVEDLWNPVPPPIDLSKITRTYDRIMMMSSDNPDLPTDIVHIKSYEKMSFRRQNPVLVWNCLVNFKGFLWSFGGRHSEKTIYKLDSTCHFQENRLKLPRGYISHECVVHNDYLYLCPDWDLSTTCTKLDYVSGKLLIGNSIQKFEPSLTNTY